MTKKLWLSVFCIALSGCISQIVPFKQHIESLKGYPIADFIEVRKLPSADRSSYKGTERVSKLTNGNLLYEFPYRLCPVFFEVNSEGIIVEITTEDGRDCY